jgi:plasmid maintenance system antidote protein VapI
MSKTKNARQSLEATLKQALSDTGKSVYALARASGVSQPVLHRFMAGQRTLTLPTADKLCAFLGLELMKSSK